MANLEKHPKKVIQEWLEAEDSPIPTHSRSPHVIGEYIKNRRHEEPRYRPRFMADAGALLICLSEERLPAGILPPHAANTLPRHRDVRERLRLPFGFKRTR
jgi:hypothetical protein